MITGSADKMAALAVDPNFKHKPEKPIHRLHLGCGARLIAGWLNIDLEKDATAEPDESHKFMAYDLRNGLPFGEASVDRIFSEHFFEHLTRHDAFRLLRECHRVLTPGGVIRVSVPDLRTLIAKYLEDEAGDKGALCFAQPVGWLPATRCQLVNEGMRLWGHLFVYDVQELTLVFREAGFNGIVRASKHGYTTIPEMPTEGRPFLGDIVIEAQR